MTDLFDKSIWAYRAVFKQTAGGGGVILVNIVPPERFVLLYGVIGNDDYDASRNINVNLYDEGGEVASILNITEGLDNALMAFPSVSATPISLGTAYANLLVIGKGDEIRISNAAAILNEELTISLRGLILSERPTVTTTGSTGTVTQTVTYDKVI